MGNYGYLRYLSVRANTAIFVAVATIAILAIMAFRANMASLFVGVSMIDLCVVLSQNRVEACRRFDACLSFVVP